MSQNQTRFSEFVRRLHLWQSPEALRRTIADGILDLISGENSIVIEFDTRERRMTSFHSHHSFKARTFFEAANSFIHQHPLNKFMTDARHSGTSLLSEHANRQQWRTTALYNEAMREDGIEDQIAVEVGRPGRFLLGVGVLRNSRGFSNRDREMLRLLDPHFAQAVTNLNRREHHESAQRRHHQVDASQKKRGLILLNEAGRVVYLSDEALRLLERYCEGGWRRRSPLPADLTAWARQQIHELNGIDGKISTAPFRRVTAGGALEIRLFHASENGHYLLVAGEVLPPPGIEPFAALSLTRREMEVLHWVCEGKTNGEIAIILNVSFYTIKAQMKSIFRKLGVETRTAAAAMAIEITSRAR